MTEDHCLRIIKYCMESHNFVGVEDIFEPNCEYFSTTYGVRANSATETIERLLTTTEKIVADGIDVYAHMMQIGAVYSKTNLYEVGKKGLLLSYGEIDDYACAFFVEMSDNGKISRLVSSVEKYGYSLDCTHLSFDDSEPFKFRHVTKSEKDYLEFIGVWLENGIVDEESFFRNLDSACVFRFHRPNFAETREGIAGVKQIMPMTMNLFYKSGAHIVWNNDNPELLYGDMHVAVKLSNQGLLKNVNVEIIEEN